MVSRLLVHNFRKISDFSIKKYFVRENFIWKKWQNGFRTAAMQTIVIFMEFR